MITLILLSLLAAPDWKISVPKSVPSVGEIRFSTHLENPGKAPPLTLVLTPEGGKPVRRPLPPKISVTRAKLNSWSVYGDLRLAFGRLKPGRYTFHLERPGQVSARAKFEVVEATLAQALKKQPKPTAGLTFTVKKGKRIGILANGRKTDVTTLAYDSLGPIQALVIAEYWNGRAWVAEGGGFCGTGLVPINVAAGARAEIHLAPVHDGIVRFRFSCRAGKKEIVVFSNPILIDTLGK